jgi:hypothetical protein
MAILTAPLHIFWRALQSFFLPQCL